MGLLQVQASPALHACMFNLYLRGELWVLPQLQAWRRRRRCLGRVSARTYAAQQVIQIQHVSLWSSRGRHSWLLRS